MKVSFQEEDKCHLHPQMMLPFMKRELEGSKDLFLVLSKVTRF